MKKRTILHFALVAIFLLGGNTLLPVSVNAAPSPAIHSKIELLLVQNSKTVAIDKEQKTLTLKGVSPTTLFFSDRPDRIAGHFNKKDYLDLWTNGKDKENFDADPPNAVLSVFEGNKDDLRDVVVELFNPRYQDDDLIYDISLIDGDLPVLGGPTSLFIDIFGVRRRAFRRGVMIGGATAATVATTEAAAHQAAETKAAAPPPPAPAATAAPAAPGLSGSQSKAVASLKELKSLQTQGLITEEQYQQESQKLLNQIAQ